MPTQTFFNLPESKRRTITDLALSEFANHTYQTASVTRVAEQAQIAKGSIYQYFADKKDIYLYLIDLVIQEKAAYLQAAHLPHQDSDPASAPAPEMTFFRYLRWIMGVSARFDVTHPDYTRLSYRSWYGDVPFREESVARIKTEGVALTRQWVQQAIDAGQVNPNINIDLAAYYILALGTELNGFLMPRLGIDQRTVTAEQLSTIDLTRVDKLLDDMVYMLEHGLGPTT